MRTWIRARGATLAVVAILGGAGCESVRELQLASVLPSPCGVPSVNELRVRGLGDFAPGTSDSLSIASSGAVIGMPDAARLSLPRATRVVSIEGLGPTGLVAFGRTAPTDLPTAWDGSGDQHVIPLAYGAPNSFCTTASLSYPRAEHRATLLSDGSVLFSGGYNRDGLPIVALERYLPAGDSASPVARFEPMGSGATLDATAVLGHDVTLLADGRALLSGGAPAVKSTIDSTTDADGIAYQGASLLSVAGAFDSAARVLIGGPRAFHAGLLLADGRVLLTGGCSELTKGQCAPGRLQASVVVFDPARDAFEAALPLLAPRAWHRAVLRDDGLVLIVGGVGDNGVALAPELYDPDESRGSSIAGPAGSAVTLPSGMVLALNDAAAASDRVVSWSGRDEAPQGLTQLATPRAQTTMTVLEDGSVLVAGGVDGQNLASASTVIGPSGFSDTVTGFAARGHTATRLRDGTVLLAGGIDASRVSSPTAVVFLRSLTGPFDTPSTLAFDGLLTLSPSRPGRVRVADGALQIDGGSKPPRTLESFAVVSGPSLSGPSGAGFSVSLLAGAEGDVEAAVLFGDPARSRYVAVLFGAGSLPHMVSVNPNRPGLPDIEEVPGCEATLVAAAELPREGAAPISLTLRDGRVTLASGVGTLLSCPGEAAPSRGSLTLGARTRSSGGSVRFDNVQLVR